MRGAQALSFEAVEIRSLNQLPDGHPSVEKTADLLVVAVLVHAPFLIQAEFPGERLAKSGM